MRLSEHPGNHCEGTPGAADNRASPKLQSTLLEGELKHSGLLGEPLEGNRLVARHKELWPWGASRLVPPLSSWVTLDRSPPLAESQYL